MIGQAESDETITVSIDGYTVVSDNVWVRIERTDDGWWVRGRQDFHSLDQHFPFDPGTTDGCAFAMKAAIDLVRRLQAFRAEKAKAEADLYAWNDALKVSPS